MFYKIVILLTCISIVNCVKKIVLDEDDQAVANAFNKAINFFNKTDHITTTQLLRIIGDDRINRNIFETYFLKNPHIHQKKWNTINEELFFDLVNAVGRNRDVSTKELAMEMIKQIEDMEKFVESLKCEETLDEVESTSSNSLLNNNN